MGEKDITEKILASFNDVFSDIVNGCLFDGEQVTQPEDFVEATPYSYYKAGGQIRDQERDVAKYWKQGDMIISLVGIENQTEPDPYMPIRVMSYDAAAYRVQLNINNTVRPYSVISLVIYLGYERPWKTPLTVRECLRIPALINNYVHDYRINLFQIAWMSREEIDRRFHGDFWIVADYLYQKRIDGNYKPVPRVMQHLQEVLELLQAIEQDKEFGVMYETMIREHPAKEDWTMCDVLATAKNEGIVVGIEQGRREGYRSAQADVARGMRREGYTDEQIARVCNTDVQTVQILLRESESAYEG